MNFIKKACFCMLVTGYLVAGVNHFYNPASYLHIIPPYIPYPVVVNILSGALEITLALLLIPTKTRVYSAYAIMLMLVAFLPVHIDMLLHTPFQLGTLTVTPLLAWLRLLLQPVLVLWAWWYTKPTNA